MSADLRKAALNLAAVLGVVMRMSDDVKHASSALDAQGKLLFLQNSLQKNGARMASLTQAVLEWKP